MPSLRVRCPSLTVVSLHTFRLLQHNRNEVNLTSTKHQRNRAGSFHRRVDDSHERTSTQSYSEGLHAVFVGTCSQKRKRHDEG